MEVKKAKKLRVAVVGSSEYKDKDALYKILDHNFEKIEVIVSGGSNSGADFIGQEYAKERGVPNMIYHARWYGRDGLYDKGAGFRRNWEIVRNSDLLLIVWDGNSRGTKHYIETAEQLKKQHKIVRFTPEPKVKPDGN